MYTSVESEHDDNRAWGRGMFDNQNVM